MFSGMDWQGLLLSPRRIPSGRRTGSPSTASRMPLIINLVEPLWLWYSCAHMWLLCNSFSNQDCLLSISVCVLGHPLIRGKQIFLRGVKRSSLNFLGLVPDSAFTSEPLTAKGITLSAPPPSHPQANRQ